MVRTKLIIEDSYERLLKSLSVDVPVNVPKKVGKSRKKPNKSKSSLHQVYLDYCKKNNLNPGNPVHAYYYTKYILEGRFELLEKNIKGDAEISYWYARDVIKGRFKLGEKAIASDIRCAYLYALNILEGRFKLGEKVIASDREFASLYTRDILKPLGLKFDDNGKVVDRKL